MPEGTKSNTLTAAKSFVLDFVERNRDGLRCLGDSIFYFGELGMQESAAPR